MIRMFIGYEISYQERRKYYRMRFISDLLDFKNLTGLKLKKLTP